MSTLVLATGNISLRDNRGTMAAVPTIANAAQFSAISNNAFSATFIANLNNVFNYQANDIPNIFNERNSSVIKTLSDELLVRVATTFPDVADKTAVLHKKKG